MYFEPHTALAEFSLVLKGGVVRPPVQANLDYPAVYGSLVFISTVTQNLFLEK